MELQSVYDALAQAQDCIRGETPEDVPDEEAREDTLNKVRDAMRAIEAMTTPSDGAIYAAASAHMGREWAEDLDKLIDRYAEPPGIAYASRVDELEKFLVSVREILDECQNDFHICERCSDQDDDATKHSDIYLLLKGSLDSTTAALSSTPRATPIDHSSEECPNFPGCHCVDQCCDGWKHPSPEISSTDLGSGA